jgi:AcrR family transcriptional regulator
MSPRPRETTDAAIMAATHRAMTRIGPRLTLADVAYEAGISPATLVQRFGSKRGLLLAFVAGGASGLREEFARLRQGAGTPLGAVYATADCMAAMAPTPETLSNSLAFLQMDLVDPDFHRHALAHSRTMQAELKTLLDEAVASGEIRRCDTGRLARAVQVVLGGALLQWAIDRDGKAVDRLRDDLHTLLAPRLTHRTATGSPRRAPVDRRERRRHRRRFTRP